ncbi:hypothetical protein [Cohnella sp.]|uniref:hypothetical protein n=1 Tax=Cohnella sp. TaxID=1883426 RepID=UPI0035626D45
MKQSILFSIVASLFLFLLLACNSEQNPVPHVTSTDIDQIKFELLDKTIMPEGIIFAIKLKNLSKFTIAQNNVYISFPIKLSIGSRGNEFKIEAKNNKLQIKPKEEIILNAFAPIEEYEKNQKLDIENFAIEIIGYIEEVKEERRFQKYGGLEAYNR